MSIAAEIKMMREAAAVLRERAQRATSPPWADSPSGNPYRALVAPKPHPDRENPETGGWAYEESYGGCLVGESLMKSDRAYIATMHPGVGLALADWLDRIADASNPGDDTDPAGLDIAKLILNVDSEVPA